MLFVRKVIERKQFCHLNYSNQPRTTLVIPLLCVCVTQTHAIRNLGNSQCCRLVKSMNVFEKENKLCPFSSSKPRPKEGKKAFSCEVACSNKASFLNQDEWPQEVEEHERKPNTSEKQSDFAGIFTDLDRIPRERCVFYCVIWNCFL